eukprot:1161622-Pelagomonas_calceolata.AAC.7
MVLLKSASSKCDCKRAKTSNVLARISAGDHACHLSIPLYQAVEHQNDLPMRYRKSAPSACSLFRRKHELLDESVKIVCEYALGPLTGAMARAAGVHGHARSPQVSASCAGYGKSCRSAWASGSRTCAIPYIHHACACLVSLRYERELRRLRQELQRRSKQLVDKRSLLEECMCASSGCHSKQLVDWGSRLSGVCVCV